MANVILSRLSAELLAEHYRSGYWKDETLYAVLRRHAQRSPDRFALRDRLRRLTFGELLTVVDAVAIDLASRGLRTGQRVAIWLPSRVEAVIAMLASSRNGYVFCPSFHRDHTCADVIALLRRTRAAALFGEAGYGAGGAREDIFAQTSDLPDLRHAYRLPPLAAGDTSLNPFAGLLDASTRTSPIDAACQNPNRVSYLGFTSGTTGQPKGVMHTDNTLLANARAVVTDWNLTADSVVYTLSPLSHNLGVGSFVTALLAGAELVVHDLPRGQSLLARLAEVGATYLVGVPTHAIDLLAEVRSKPGSSLAAVKGFRISGAAVPKDVVTELMQYGATPQSGYGTTETCSHHYTLPHDDPQLIAETSGRACAGVETRIWRQDNPDAEAEPGAIGQIGCRGASLMLGYFDDQATTEDSFNASGWYMTGDLGCLDSAGYLRVTGRAKDLIIRGGHNIHPARIEALAMRHAAIERAAAFPVADSRLGEKVCLAVMFRAGRQASAQDILAHLDAVGLSRYDMPEYFLQLDQLPLTSSGKTLKRELVTLVQEGRLQPTSVRWEAKRIEK